MTDSKCDRCRCRLPDGQAQQILDDAGDVLRLCLACMQKWWEDSKAHHPQSPPTK